MPSNRLLRLILLVGLGGFVAALVKALTRDEDPLPAPSASPAPEPWPPLRPVPDEAAEPETVVEAEPVVEAAPEPEPVVETEPEPVAVDDDAVWVEPDAEGNCPEGFPVKAKMKSKIFHVEGQFAYERTNPDRCYRSAEDAEADGLRAAKR